MTYYFCFIKAEHISSEYFFFSLAFRCSPLNSPLTKNPCALPHTASCCNKHSVQTRKRGMGMHHFPGVPGTERLSLCNFRQPCETHPYSAKLYGKFDSLPKGGVDRYYEDHVPWLPLGKKGTFAENHSLFFYDAVFYFKRKTIYLLYCVPYRDTTVCTMLWSILFYKFKAIKSWRNFLICLFKTIIEFEKVNCL